MSADRSTALSAFTSWAQAHITGDEKGEAQIFIDQIYRDTSASAYDTFSWPHFPTAKAMLAVAEAGREVRRIRAEALPNIKGRLREHYRTLELPGANPLKAAHAALDTAVLAAYGFHPAKDLLAQLLALNQSVAPSIESGVL